MIKNIIIFISILISLEVYANKISILSDEIGSGTLVEKHFKVIVNYKGTLENGIEFDSSFKRNEPFTFQIGLRQVIDGWERGILGMRVGGKRTIKIPPEMAYGSRGAGELIPPNSTLIFEVEIIDTFPPSYGIILAKNIFSKQKDGFIIIDIRNVLEQKKTGLIKGSIPMTAFDAAGNFQQSFLKKYEDYASFDDHVVFVSSRGEISSILANGFEERLGAKNMYSLLGGIEKWISDGWSLIK